MKKLTLAALFAASTALTATAADSETLTFSRVITGTCGVTTVGDTSGGLVLDGSETEPADMVTLVFSGSAGNASYDVKSLTSTGTDNLTEADLKLMAKDSGSVSQVTSAVNVTDAESVKFYVAVANAVTAAGSYEASAVIELTCL
ncbi:hypothetical protein [uncultured Ferrimonas sp.]|uniref:hypothetical protein n=1 Tax=uncultured Ferrimonas sp. TaxID=432640 RepID=UPI002630A499|nr:hypothetical protein [uncultured Ferrimonas sp.]